MSDALSEAALLVHLWLDIVFGASDLAAAWPLTDEPLRLALAQSWIVLEADRPEVDAVDRDVLAALLAEPSQPAHPHWHEFAGWRVIRWREVLPEYVSVADLRGIVSGDRPLTADIEEVWVTQASESTVSEGVKVEAQRFLVRHVDGVWLLAGIGGVLPIPGWPPTETPRL